MRRTSKQLHGQLIQEESAEDDLSRGPSQYDRDGATKNWAHLVSSNKLKDSAWRSALSASHESVGDESGSYDKDIEIGDNANDSEDEQLRSQYVEYERMLMQKNKAKKTDKRLKYLKLNEGGSVAKSSGGSQKSSRSTRKRNQSNKSNKVAGSRRSIKSRKSGGSTSKGQLSIGTPQLESDSDNDDRDSVARGLI